MKDMGQTSAPENRSNASGLLCRNCLAGFAEQRNDPALVDILLLLSSRERFKFFRE
jgi:hypothetical protein